MWFEPLYHLLLRAQHLHTQLYASTAVYMKYSIISRSLVWLFIAMSVVFCFCFWFWYSLFHSVSVIAIQCVILHRLLYYTDDRSDVATATALVLVCWNVLLLVHSVKVCTPLMKHHRMCALKQSNANLINNQKKWLKNPLHSLFERRTKLFQF